MGHKFSAVLSHPEGLGCDCILTFPMGSFLAVCVLLTGEEQAAGTVHKDSLGWKI